MMYAATFKVQRFRLKKYSLLDFFLLASVQFFLSGCSLEKETNLTAIAAKPKLEVSGFNMSLPDSDGKSIAIVSAKSNINSTIKFFCYKTENKKPVTNDSCFSENNVFKNIIYKNSHFAWVKDNLDNISDGVTFVTPCGEPGNRAALKNLSSAAEGDITVVCLLTDLGEMVFELHTKKAPKLVANFLSYVGKTGSSFYSYTLFHRVKRNFVIESGRFDTTNSTSFTEMVSNAAVEIELTNATGLSNLYGTIGSTPQASGKAAAVFFIHLKDNTEFDQKNASNGIGYSVFGRLIAGDFVLNRFNDLDVLDVNNSSTGEIYADFPKKITILRWSFVCKKSTDLTLSCL